MTPRTRNIIIATMTVATMTVGVMMLMRQQEPLPPPRLRDPVCSVCGWRAFSGDRLPFPDGSVYTVPVGFQVTIERSGPAGNGVTCGPGRDEGKFPVLPCSVDQLLTTDGLIHRWWWWPCQRPIERAGGHNTWVGDPDCDWQKQRTEQRRELEAANDQKTN